MTAITRNMTKIWIVAAGTNASALSSSVWSTSNTSGYIAGQIKDYKKTGGETNTDSVPVFGGFVDEDKPRSAFELEFTVVPAIEASTYEWEKLAYALDSTSGTAVYTSKDVGADQAVFIQSTSGSANKSWGFNNCNVIVLEQTHQADGNMEQTLKVKFSPTDSAGIPNHQYSKQAVTSLTAWASLATS